MYDSMFDDTWFSEKRKKMAAVCMADTQKRMDKADRAALEMEKDKI
ncbi:MAG: hypothetical protein Q4E24_14380 [bacterium]|nr:hypothetical protein [bacterium]